MTVKTKSIRGIVKGKNVTIVIRGPAGAIMPSIVSMSKKKGVKVTGGGSGCAAVAGTYKFWC